MTMLGYELGGVPHQSAHYFDKVILLIVFLSLLPAVIEAHQGAAQGLTFARLLVSGARPVGSLAIHQAPLACARGSFIWRLKSATPSVPWTS